MADTNYIPIDQVPKDYDPTKIVYLTNPLTKKFSHKYDGKDFSIKAGATVQLIEPIAHHLAGHIAKAALLPAEIDRETAFRDANPEKGYMEKAVSPKSVDAYAKNLVSSAPPKLKATA